MSTPSLFVAWSIDAFSLFTASSIFAFAVAFSSSVAFGVWSISAFLASAALSIVAFASSFLTTVGWILLIESKPFDFAVSTPALFVAWSIAFLAVVTASSTFAFLPPSLHLSRLVFGRFLLFSFRRFINRCFASSFLTTVGWILLLNLSHLISQCLHRHYLLLGLLTLSHYLLPHRLSLLPPPFLHLSH